MLRHGAELRPNRNLDNPLHLADFAAALTSGDPKELQDILEEINVEVRQEGKGKKGGFRGTQGRLSPATAADALSYLRRRGFTKSCNC
jgi:hypothetical protein